MSVQIEGKQNSNQSYSGPLKEVECKNIEDSIFSDDNNSEINQVSESLIDFLLPDYIIDLFNLKGETKDGEIQDIKQGKIGDCWLLAGINSLSNSNYGKSIIKDSFTYNEDSTTVHFKGLDCDYTITNKELKDRKKERSHTTGDDDVVILEMAMEKAISDFENMKVGINFQSQQQYLNPPNDLIEQNDGISPINSGNSTYLYYLLVGKKADVLFELPDELVDNYKSYGKICLACDVCFKKDLNTSDINGKKVDLVDNHAYSISDMNEKFVTLVDPHDTSKSLEISMDDFKSNMLAITSCNLLYSEDVDFDKEIAKTYTTDEQGLRCFEFQSEYTIDIDYYNDMKDEMEKHGKDIIEYENCISKQIDLYDGNVLSKIQYYYSNDSLAQEIVLDSKRNSIETNYYYPTGELYETESLCYNEQNCKYYYRTYRYDLENNLILNKMEYVK